jgi:hypothetical protein
MGNAVGTRTNFLMQATNHLKDNRILPTGFSDDDAYFSRIAPVETSEDVDFIAGSDTTAYEAKVSGAAQIRVSLLYQSLGSRFARELLQTHTDDVAAFRTMFERANVAPIEVASMKIDLNR